MAKAKSTTQGVSRLADTEVKEVARALGGRFSPLLAQVPVPASTQAS